MKDFVTQWHRFLLIDTAIQRIAARLQGKRKEILSTSYSKQTKQQKFASKANCLIVYVKVVLNRSHEFIAKKKEKSKDKTGRFCLFDSGHSLSQRHYSAPKA